MKQANEKPKMRAPIPPVSSVSMEHCRSELERLQKQFIVLHDLPKIDGISATEYMRETFDVLRQRCIDLHWRQCSLLQQKRRESPAPKTFEKIFDPANSSTFSKESAIRAFSDVVVDFN
jgi:hypothetical protein